MQKVRILHIIKSLGRGGAERLLVETIAVHASEYTFDVVYFLPWKNQLVKDLEGLGCKVYLLSAKRTLYMLFRLPRLIRLIRTNQYQILHCHLPWAGIVGRIAGRLTDIPVVYTEHNNFFSYNRVTQFIHRLNFNWVAQIIAVSHDAQAALQKVNRSSTPVTTIFNGVNTEKFDRTLFTVEILKNDLNIPGQCIVISTVAVFRQQKRLDRWMSIAHQVVKRTSNVRFIIMGDGPLNDSIRSLTAQYHLNEYVIFTGLIEDPRPFLACTDIYLMTSDYEGLPVALLEAMSMQCLPVVTAVGGIPGLIHQNRNGILYEKDKENDAVDSILDLIAFKDKRNTLSVNARKTVSELYSMERMTSELESVYKQVLNKTAVIL